MSSETPQRTLMPSGIDLTSDGWFHDPTRAQATFDRLRAEAPVAWHARGGAGFWSVCRYRDVERVLRDVESYGFGDGHLLGGRDASRSTAAAEAIAFRDGAAPFTGATAPAAARLDALAVDALAPGIRVRVVERLAAFAGRGVVDFVDLIAPLAPEVRATLAGVPGAQQDPLIARIEAIRNERRAGEPQQRAIAELLDFAEELTQRKRAHPGEDIVSDWLAAEPTDAPLGGREVGVFLYAFIGVAAAATRNVAAVGQKLLLDAPAATLRLRREPTLLAGAIEEMLRLAPPFHYARRIAQRDSLLGGQRIAKGEELALWLGAANRDPAAFERPAEFAPERDPHPNLALSSGGAISLCATLTRVELAILFEELIARFPEMLPAGPIEFGGTSHEHATRSLPVHLGTPA